MCENKKPYTGSIDPNDISSGESLAKWAYIKIGPNTWCGEWKPKTDAVPPIPDLGPYPEPEPPA